MPPSPGMTTDNRIVVIDEKNLIKIWLDEKIERREITVQEADEHLKQYEDKGKLWIGPFKDGLGSVKLIYKLAHDVRSWKGARVYFTPGKHGDLVIIKGWPAGRKILSGPRYRVDNPKIVELQIGKPGLRAAARESAKFGIYLVVAVDIGDYLLRDNAKLSELLGHLTIDIPSVVIASTIGAAAGSFVLSTSVPMIAAIGTFACGPLLVAFGVGVLVGYGLYKLDEHFHLTDKVTEAYDRGLTKLAQLWHELGTEAQQRFKQLENSSMVHDLSRETKHLASKLAREGDWVRWKLEHL